MQDWELEVADPKRIEEFLDEFQSVPIEARVCLAELLMASFDDALDTGLFVPKQWDRYCQFLSNRFKAHTPMLRYWSNKNGGDSFAVERHIAESFKGKL